MEPSAVEAEKHKLDVSNEETCDGSHLLSTEDAAFLNGFTDEQRKRMLRKVDWRLIPVLSLLYLVSYLDRANIGNANIEGLSEDLRLSSSQYNLCLAVFFIPYVTLEIPANMIYRKFDRPSYWMAIMVTSWGLVSMCMGFAQDFGGLATCRIIMGAAEAGFFPGAVLIITSWYHWDEAGSRIALVYTASALAGATSGLLAYLIVKMDGLGGYAGWRWIFLIEGGASTLLGLICPFILPDMPKHSKWLTDDEKRYLILRKVASDGGKEVQAEGERFSWPLLWTVITDWKIWLQGVMAVSNTIPNYGFKFTMPQIMKNMGYVSANAQLLTIPPYVLGALSAYLSSRFADRFKWRMPFIVSAQVLVLIGFSITFAYGTHIGDRIPECYFAICLACIGLYPIIPGTEAWNASNLAGPAKRAAGIALLCSFSTAGGLGGSFIYKKEEAPRYLTGFGTSLAIAGAGIVAALTLEFALWRINAKNAKMTLEEVQAKYTDEQLGKMGDKSPLFVYKL